MPEWLLERGIGETRAALVEGGRIVETRILLDGVLPAGSVVEARLRSVGAVGSGAIAVTGDGAEILLPRRPPGVSEGASIHVEITREPISGNEAWKRPLGRVGDGPPRLALPEGRDLPFPPRSGDELEESGWSDLLDEARSGIVRFAGGELRLYATPAMTLIDVDGTLPAAELALAGAEAAGRAIRRLAIGGSIGIDLPTVPGRNLRQNAAEALDGALGQVRFERTAVNGFGFVQVVRPRRHASLLELAQDRPAFEARALLRRAALGHGAVVLDLPPAVHALLQSRPEWIAALARQRGGGVTLRRDPALAISAGHAEPA